jgi:hypothetical protein
MPTPLSKRESSAARAYSRSVKALERAGSIYAKAGRQEQQLAKKIFAMKKGTRVISPHIRAIRITEEGRYLLVTDQFAAATADEIEGGEAKVWAHAAARHWKLSEKNLD